MGRRLMEASPVNTRKIPDRKEVLTKSDVVPNCRHPDNPRLLQSMQAPECTFKLVGITALFHTQLAHASDCAEAFSPAGNYRWC
jgi:hypothetical protein